jgi:hypothetical protein
MPCVRNKLIYCKKEARSRLSAIKMMMTEKSFCEQIFLQNVRFGKKQKKKKRETPESNLKCHSSFCLAIS